MSVNLDKFKDSLVSAWKEVMDEKHPTDWAIFGYEGQTFDLKLVSKGDNGLEEMIEDFNSGKIMYGLCRVKLKDRNMEKIALINWQGEGAPLARKGTCANHVATIKSFFKGVHVTINARTDEEVDPAVILETVGKSTAADGVKMSSSLELDDPKVGPIGAIYKRVNPQEEINAKIKDDFWRQEQAEEERRKRAEQDKIRKFSQNEVKLLRRESQEYFNEQERASSTSSSTPISSPSPTLAPTRTNGNGFGSGADSSRSSVSPTPPSFSNAFMATEKAAVLKASAPRKNSASENLVRQRIKSFDGNPNETPSFQYHATNGGGATNGNRSPASKNGDASPDSESLSVLRRKQMFESGRVSNSASNLIRKDPAEEIKSLQAEAQMPKAAPPNSKVQDVVSPVSSKVPAPVVKSPEPVMKSPEPVPEPVIAKSPEPIQRDESPIRRTPSPQKPPPMSFNRKSPSPVPIKSPSPQPVKAYNLPFHIGGGVSEKLAAKINKNCDISLTDPTTNYSYEEPVTVAKSPTPTPPVVANNSNSAFEDRTIQSAEVSPTVVNEAPERISTPVIEGTASPALEIKPEMGLCARALYDYQAADDSEITFDPGELITNIETIDEGWWEGKGPQGVYGLFPANYVELLN